MIGSLRLSQFALPVLLGVVNVALVAFWLGYLEPLKEELANQRRAFQNKAASLHAPLAKAESDRDQIEESREAYERLLEHGFLDPQDRLHAARLFDELRQTYALTSVTYELSPERLREDPGARESGWGIISTRMAVKMRGLLDTDLIAFARAVADRFPGQVKLESVSMDRLANPTRESLAALREGQPVELVSGGAVFEWRRLRPLTAEEMRR